MKKSLFLLSLFLCLSCSQSVEKLLVGNWVLTSAECVNLKEFSSAKEKLALTNIEQNIAQIKRALDSETNAGEREKLTKRIETLSASKKKVGESVKTEIETVLKNVVGNVVYDFSDNGAFGITCDAEKVRGTYSISGDTVFVVLENQENDRFVIKSLTASALTLTNVQEDFQKETSMKIELGFKKN